MSMDDDSSLFDLFTLTAFQMMRLVFCRVDVSFLKFRNRGDVLDGVTVMRL